MANGLDARVERLEQTAKADCPVIWRRTIVSAEGAETGQTEAQEIARWRAMNPGREHVPLRVNTVRRVLVSSGAGH